MIDEWVKTVKLPTVSPRLDPAEKFRIYQQIGHSDKGKEILATIEKIACITRTQANLPTYNITMNSSCQKTKLGQQYKEEEIMLIRKRVSITLLTQKIAEANERYRELVILIKRGCKKATKMVVSLVKEMANQDKSIEIHPKLLLQNTSSLREIGILEEYVAIWIRNSHQRDEGDRKKRNSKREFFEIKRGKEGQGNNVTVQDRIQRIIDRTKAKTKEFRRQEVEELKLRSYGQKEKKKEALGMKHHNLKENDQVRKDMIAPKATRVQTTLGVVECIEKSFEGAGNYHHGGKASLGEGDSLMKKILSVNAGGRKEPLEQGDHKKQKEERIPWEDSKSRVNSHTDNKEEQWNLTMHCKTKEKENSAKEPPKPEKEGQHSLAIKERKKDGIIEYTWKLVRIENRTKGYIDNVSKLCSKGRQQLEWEKRTAGWNLNYRSGKRIECC